MDHVHWNESGGNPPPEWPTPRGGKPFFEKSKNLDQESGTYEKILKEGTTMARGQKERPPGENKF